MPTVRAGMALLSVTSAVSPRRCAHPAVPQSAPSSPGPCSCRSAGPAGKWSRASCRTRPRWCSRCRAPSARTGSRTYRGQQGEKGQSGAGLQGGGMRNALDELGARQHVPCMHADAVPRTINCSVKHGLHGAHMALSRMGPSRAGASAMAALGGLAGLCACATTVARRRPAASRRERGAELSGWCSMRCGKLLDKGVLLAGAVAGGKCP